MAEGLHFNETRDLSTRLFNKTENGLKMPHKKWTSIVLFIQKWNRK